MRETLLVFVAALLAGAAVGCRPEASPERAAVQPSLPAPGGEADPALGGVCSLHGVELREGTVPIVYGRHLWGDDYYEAMDRDFLNAADFIGGGCVVGPETEGSVAYCPECRRARARWLAANGR